MEERPRFPSDSKLLLLSQTGTFEDARTLYLSEGYGPRGHIYLQGLYGVCAKQKLLASAVASGSTNHRSG